jgi:hypothetical protein
LEEGGRLSDDGAAVSDQYHRRRPKTNETPSQKDNDNDEYSTKNHYDDPPWVGTKYARDYRSGSGEDVAIFSGLQVIQGRLSHGNDYPDGQSLFRILTDSEKRKAKSIVKAARSLLAGAGAA